MSVQRLKDIPAVANGPKTPSMVKSVFLKSVMFLSTSRNIVIVLLCAVIFWSTEKVGEKAPVELTGNVKEGLPEFKLPPFEAHNNGTDYNFMGMVSAMSWSCIVVPLLAILETVTVNRAFCK